MSRTGTSALPTECRTCLPPVHDVFLPILCKVSDTRRILYIYEGQNYAALFGESLLLKPMVFMTVVVMTMMIIMIKLLNTDTCEDSESVRPQWQQKSIMMTQVVTTRKVCGAGIR
jgi:hypothetical protein